MENENQPENYEKPRLAEKNALDLAHDVVFVEDYFNKLQQAEEIIHKLGNPLAFSRTVKRALDELYLIGANANSCRQILEERPELSEFGYTTEKLAHSYLAVTQSLFTGLTKRRVLRERVNERINNPRGLPLGLSLLMMDAYKPKQ